MTGNREFDSQKRMSGEAVTGRDVKEDADRVTCMAVMRRGMSRDGELPA